MLWGSSLCFYWPGLSGLTFRKDLYLASAQIFPVLEENKRPLTRLQERLIKKLGEHAYPFYFELPPHCPASVTLQPAPGDTGKPCGIDYEMKAFVGDSQDDKPHKRLDFFTIFSPRKKHQCTNDFFHAKGHLSAFCQIENELIFGPIEVLATVINVEIHFVSFKKTRAKQKTGPIYLQKNQNIQISWIFTEIRYV